MIILCISRQITVVNMFLNIKIAFMFFVLHLYIWWIWAVHSFLMPDGYDVLCSMENNSYFTHQCFFCDTKKFYFLSRLKCRSSIKFEALSCVLFIMRKSENRGAYGSIQRNSAWYWFCRNQGNASCETKIYNFKSIIRRISFVCNKVIFTSKIRI